MIMVREFHEECWQWRTVQKVEIIKCRSGDEEIRDGPLRRISGEMCRTQHIVSLHFPFPFLSIFTQKSLNFFNL